MVESNVFNKIKNSVGVDRFE